MNGYRFWREHVFTTRIIKNKIVLLDFSEVIFISDEGIKMLENIRNGRVKVTNCSAFIRSILPGLITDKTGIEGRRK